MTIDKEQCPVCGEYEYTSASGKCYSCGYDDSMQRKMQYNVGITAPAAANGTIAGTYLGSALTNGDDVPYGAELIFTAAANDENYKQFIIWVITGTGNYSVPSLTDNPIKITIFGGVTITATFATKKKLTIVEPTNGAIYVDGELLTFASNFEEYYEVDTIVTLLAVPEVDPENDGMYEFTQWASGKTDNPYELTMDDDIELTPVFSKAYVGYKFIAKVGATRKLFTEIDEDTYSLTSIAIDDDKKEVTLTFTVI